MSGRTSTAINANDGEAVTERPVWRRCWCWQYGRCLVDCPTADLPRPKPMTDENWKRSYLEVMGRG